MKQQPVTLLLTVMLITGITDAQQTERFDPQKDKRELSGYTIQLIPLPGHTFGFHVMKDGKPVYVQFSDPFSLVRVGFKNKDDAFNLAGWVVEESKKNGRPPVGIPADVGRQLHLLPEIKLPEKKQP